MSATSSESFSTRLVSFASPASALIAKPGCRICLPLMGAFRDACQKPGQIPPTATTSEAGAPKILSATFHPKCGLHVSEVLGHLLQVPNNSMASEFRLYRRPVGLQVAGFATSRSLGTEWGGCGVCKFQGSQLESSRALCLDPEGVSSGMRRGFVLCLER